MIDPSLSPQGVPRSPLTLAALLDVLAERYGTAIAAAVVAQLREESGRCDDVLASDVVHRAIEMANDGELAIAGTAFLDHLAISAVADTAGFRAAARSAGVRADALSIEKRLRVDAAFASAWREHRRADPHFGGRDAAVALMRETLRSAH